MLALKCWRHPEVLNPGPGSRGGPYTPIHKQHHASCIIALHDPRSPMQALGSHSSQNSVLHRAASAPRQAFASWPKTRCRAISRTIVARMAAAKEEIATVVPNPAVSNFPVPTDLEQYIDRPEIARANMVSA